ncbi:heparinase II/III family protein, partial [Photobacterium makurazakiensis]|uniref:heparinase II/III domain-containing protein n=1 Tax=Photobacterium makurazakiensis TaxID=2910234 RepID=UPI003D0F966A
MLQFSQQQLSSIRQRATKQIVQQIVDDNDVVLSSDTLVPPDNRATWNLYYFCPEHGVRLTWDRNKPEEHCCPIDGKTFTGEPYDGAWWRWLNGLNAKACNQLGLLWQITGEQHYLEKVRDILMQYSQYYPDYEPHGGIPYNGPGKANAQTLCEANCHLDFALGYDFVKEALTAEERNNIEVRLLREGADFLMQHRSAQLHNHEMKINATIGVIGLLLDEPRYIEFALNSEYGIHYQLNHGLVGEGMWFEGSIHYHYYALQALMAYEKLARGTPHSVRSNPHYHTMLAFPLKLVLNTGSFPRLNDVIAGQERLTHTHLFEFAYSEFKEPLFASALASIYQNVSRDNMDALLYGVDTLPDVEPLKAQDIHAAEAGITLLNNDKTNNAMLLKHSPYGGEHDHYDRLGLLLIKEGKEILPDLGTTGYGAELHYGYYKNTATHNTLVVNQKNQTPANPILLNFKQQESLTFIDTLVDWSLPAAEVDSHTLVHWDEQSYKDIKFRRSVIWLGDAAIEINQIENPHQQQLDLTWHARGKMVSNISGEDLSSSPLEGPLARMNQCRITDIANGVTHFEYDVGQETPYRQQLCTEGGEHWLTGLAPDNPATSELAYLLLRSSQQHLKNVVLHDLVGQYQLESANWEDNSINIVFSLSGHTKEIEVNFDNGK